MDLVMNLQESEGSYGDLLERVADCMLFGALPACPTCNEHKLVKRKGKQDYFCKGYLTAWTKCPFRASAVERIEWKIPASMKKKNKQFLKDFKFVKNEIVFKQKKEKEPEVKKEPAKKKRKVETPKKQQKAKITVKGNSAVHEKSGETEK